MNVMEQGWIDAPKGLFQVLWERGWVDPDNMTKYVKTTRDAWFEADKKNVKEYLYVSISTVCHSMCIFVKRIRFDTVL